MTPKLVLHAQGEPGHVEVAMAPLDIDQQILTHPEAAGV
jgi:hypothetical protein